MPQRQQDLNLVADIGGTSARLGLAREGALIVETVRTYAREDYTGPNEAVARFLQEIGQPVAGCTACIAIAAPVDRLSIARNPDQGLTFTNSPWVVVPSAFEAAFDLARLIVINDFEAQAYALPRLDSADITAVGKPSAGVDDNNAEERWPMLVVGPGTGLGAALWLARAKRVICTEGGQISFAPGDAVELGLLQSMMNDSGHVAAERFLSGDGLVLLHQRLHDGETLDAADISAGALDDSTSPCAHTMARFFAILGSTVGDLTLATGARGGVYLAGGILPRVPDLLAKSAFRERFVDKGAFRTYLDAVPTYLVRARYPGLMGAAAAAHLF